MRHRAGLRLSWALAGLCILSAACSATAQNNPDTEEITFPTVDKVNLKGTFYRGKGVRSQKSPVVILLHKFGSDRTKGNWQDLALALQKKGCSVLSFDFRGHGKSTELRDKQVFWSNPNNRLAAYRTRLNPNALPTRINAKEFHPTYLPMLLNDISAARRFIDLQNDAGFCNSGKIFLIGEEDAATLGMIWIAGEYIRYGIAPAFPGARPPQHIAGTDICGAIWLTIDAVPAPNGFPLRTMPYLTSGAWGPQGKLAEPLREKTPMCFIYGEKDTAAGKHADYFYSRLLQADKVDPNDQIKYKSPVKGTKLSGVSLLGQSSLEVDKTITDFIDEIRQRGTGNNWVLRNVDKIDILPVPLTTLGFGNVR